MITRSNPLYQTLKMRIIDLNERHIARNKKLQYFFTNSIHAKIEFSFAFDRLGLEELFQS